MTGHYQPDHSDEYHEDDGAVDRSLDAHQRAVADDLDTVLDIEAGLREILLQSRHDSLVDGLDTVLDAEAGLRDILPAATPPGPATRPEPRAAEGDGTAAEFLLHSVSPQVRLALRNDPFIAEARSILDHARNLARDPRSANAIGLALAIANGIDRYLAHTGYPALGRARALAQGLARALDRDLARTLDRAYALAHALDLARARDLAHAHDLAHARDLARTLALARDRARDSTDDLDHDLALTFSRDIAGICMNGIRHAISTMLGREVPELDESSVNALLDDFTTSDLRTADLGHLDLVGVRWSESGTLWPVMMDVEELKSRSEEIPTERGIYVVRSGTTPDRDFVEQS